MPHINYTILALVFISLVFIILVITLLYQRKNFKKFFGRLTRIDEIVQQKERERMDELHTNLETKRNELLLEQEALRKKAYSEIELLRDSLNTKFYKDQEEARLHLEEFSEKIKEDTVVLELTFAELAQQKADDIKTIEAALEDLKEKRENTIKALKEEEREKNELNFHSITLSAEDIEDITQLKTVEKAVHNKDVLRKLIYKTYVEGPMNDLFNRLEITNTPGIYKIESIKDKKVYIGQSVNVRNRLRDHVKSAVGISSIANQVIHDAMGLEGIENFTFNLLDSCGREKLNDREKYWIDYYKANEWGYNKTKGGS